MKADPHAPASRPTPTELVTHMLIITGPAIGQEMGEQYLDLAIELEAFMGASCGLLEWEALDVAEFVRTTCRGRAARISRCCNLAALLSWAIGFGGTRSLEMAVHYDTLLRVCPRDARAHAYIRWGAERARGIEDEPPPELSAHAVGSN